MGEFCGMVNFDKISGGKTSARIKGEDKVAELAAEGLNVHAIAARLGIHPATATKWRVAWERRTGGKLPREHKVPPRVRAAKPTSGSPRTARVSGSMERARIIDAKLAAVDSCAKCGLRMFYGRSVHEAEGCLLGSSASGTSNLGEASKL